MHHLLSRRFHPARAVLVAGVLPLMLLAACAPAAAPAPTSTSAPAVRPTAAATSAAAARPATQSAAAALRSYVPPAPPPTLSQSSIKVASVSGSWSVRMAPLIAKDKGFWTQEGLTNVELTVVGPAPTHMAGLIGGGFDFSINLTTDTIARTNAQGEKVFAIAGSTNAPSYSLFGKGVSSVAELKGKVIATDAPGGTGELLTLDILNKYGLKKSDVSLVPVAGTIEEREQAMLNGVATGALGAVADLPRLREGGVVQLARMSEVYPDYQTAVTAGRGAILDAHPDTAAAFLKGLIRGFAFLQDPANTTAVLETLKKNGVAVDENNWSDTLAIQRELLTTDGSINTKGVDIVLQREKEANRVPPDASTQKLLRTDALERAHKELGLN
jgi:ABC-type nitrate/sulfonate/bicarbonate transport system substrate-binding protein